jgi:hypothetical protein
MDLVKLDELISIPNKALNEAEYRTWITELQDSVVENNDVLDRHECISAGCTLEQAITPGIYTRELTMTEGSLVFSRIHLQTHPYLVTKGKVSVYDGDTIQIIEAPYKGVTKAGTKRVLYIHEETTWITFHPTDLEDIEGIDMAEIITCETFEEFEQLKIEVVL